jgi:hypothetical protein
MAIGKMNQVINELKAINSDINKRKEVVRHTLNRIGYKHLGESYEADGWGGHQWEFKRGDMERPIYQWNVSCVFGGFDTYNRFNATKPYRWFEKVIVKNGIEILPIKPVVVSGRLVDKAKDLMSVADLKKSCELNGIKPKTSWKKSNYLSALMKA